MVIVNTRLQGLNTSDDINIECFNRRSILNFKMLCVDR